MGSIEWAYSGIENVLGGFYFLSFNFWFYRGVFFFFLTGVFSMVLIKLVTYFFAFQLSKPVTYGLTMRGLMCNLPVDSLHNFRVIFALLRPYVGII